jgi:hypothetical protein
MMLQAVSGAQTPTLPQLAENEAAAGSSGEAHATRITTPHAGQTALQDELRSAALRMRLEMPLKER